MTCHHVLDGCDSWQPLQVVSVYALQEFAIWVFNVTTVSSSHWQHMLSGIFFIQNGTFGWLHWQQAIVLIVFTCLQTMAVAVEVDEAVTLVAEVVAVGVTLVAEAVVAVGVTLVDAAVAVAVEVTLVAVVVALGVTLVAEAVAVVVAGTLVVVVVEEEEEEVAAAKAPWSLRQLELLYPLPVWHLLSQLVSV